MWRLDASVGLDARGGARLTLTPLASQESNALLLPSLASPPCFPDAPLGTANFIDEAAAMAALRAVPGLQYKHYTLVPKKLDEKTSRALSNPHPTPTPKPNPNPALSLSLSPKPHPDPNPYPLPEPLARSPEPLTLTLALTLARFWVNFFTHMTALL